MHRRTTLECQQRFEQRLSLLVFFFLSMLPLRSEKIRLQMLNANKDYDVIEALSREQRFDNKVDSQTKQTLR